MLDYYANKTRYQEHEREIRHHLLVQKALKARREKGCPGAVARAWSWLGSRAAALLPGKQRLPAPERGGC
jgi:hypothetical protein